MTKEEILKKVLSADANQNWVDVCLFDDGLDGDVGTVYSAMDEYAKQCLGEATNLLRRAYQLNKDDMGFDIDVSNFFSKIGESLLKSKQ